MYTEPSYFQIIEAFVLACVTHPPDADVRPWVPERTQFPLGNIRLSVNYAWQVTELGAHPFLNGLIGMDVARRRNGN